MKKVTISVVMAVALVTCVGFFGVKTASAYTTPTYDLEQTVTDIQGNKYVSAGDTLEYTINFSTTQYGVSPIVKSTIDDVNLDKKSVSDVQLTADGQIVDPSKYNATYSINPQAYALSAGYGSKMQEGVEYSFSFRINVKDTVTDAATITSQASASAQGTSFPTSTTEIPFASEEVADEYTMTTHITDTTGSKYVFAGDTLILTTDFMTTNNNVKPTIGTVISDWNLNRSTARDFKLIEGNKVISSADYVVEYNSHEGAYEISSTGKSLTPNKIYQFSFKIDVNNSLTRWKDGLQTFAYSADSSFPFSYSKMTIVNPQG